MFALAVIVAAAVVSAGILVGVIWALFLDLSEKCDGEGF